jgi:hypothetical protein
MPSGSPVRRLRAATLTPIHNENMLSQSSQGRPRRIANHSVDREVRKGGVACEVRRLANCHDKGERSLPFSASAA